MGFWRKWGFVGIEVVDDGFVEFKKWCLVWTRTERERDVYIM